MSIRVVLADDHPVVRAGVKTMLEKESDLRVVGEIAEGSQLEILTRQWQPDMLVLDVNMPGLDPAAATHRLKEQCPALHILVLTAYDDDAYVTGLLSAGATGNLDSATGQTIVDLFRQLNAEGQSIVLVTHAPEIAAQARRVIWMRDGKLMG